MNLSRFVDGQIKEAIERPAAIAILTVLLGAMAGMQVKEVLDGLLDTPPHLHSLVLRSLLTLVFVLLPVWYAYCLAQAIRQLRDTKTVTNAE